MWKYVADAFLAAPAGSGVNTGADADAGDDGDRDMADAVDDAVDDDAKSVDVVLDEKPPPRRATARAAAAAAPESDDDDSSDFGFDGRGALPAARPMPSLETIVDKYGVENVEIITRRQFEKLRDAEREAAKGVLAERNPLVDIAALDTSIDEGGARKHDYYVRIARADGTDDDDDENAPYAVKAPFVTASGLKDHDFDAKKHFMAHNLATKYHAKALEQYKNLGHDPDELNAKIMAEVMRMRNERANGVELVINDNENYDYEQDHDYLVLPTMEPLDVALHGLENPRYLRMFAKEWWLDNWSLASPRGTEAHRNIEIFYNGGELTPAYAQTNHGREFIRFAQEPEHSRDLILRTELSVVAVYGDNVVPGQIDAVFQVRGARRTVDIYDWKNIVNLTREKIRDATVQLNQYIIAFEESCPGWTVRNAYLVNFPPTPGAKYVKIPIQRDVSVVMDRVVRKFGAEALAGFTPAQPRAPTPARVPSKKRDKKKSSSAAPPPPKPKPRATMELDFGRKL